MNEQTIEMQPEAYVAGQGGGAVNSVNGQTGDVVLTTSDLENTSDYQTGSEVESAISQAINVEVTARQAADNNLQTQIDGITASSDVTDIVGTYAELEDYDTSSLGNNDIIKVLQDESQNDETTYYRWSTTTQSFTLIGEEGPYYTKSAVDTLLNAKQNTLTAGSNITISSDTISATDTTYSAFTGTDGTAAGTAGLVPAPATTDAGKYLKADGTWDTVSAGPTVVQTTGTSTTDVMSQNAVTSMICNDPATVRQIKVGSGAESTGSWSTAAGGYAKATGDRSVAFGLTATASGTSAVALGDTAVAAAKYTIGIGFANGANDGAKAERSVAIGMNASARGYGSVALGANSKATAQGQFDIGASSTGGYNSSSYRLITGVYDGQSAHDAATYGQLNTRLGGLTIVSISQTDYDNLQSYDANTLYVITGA